MTIQLFKSLQNSGGVPDIIKQFNQFRQNFKGDPRSQIQQLLNSGRITQAQYNEAVKKAQMLQSLINNK